VADNDVDCSDGIDCTVDSCGGLLGCDNIPDDSLCDDQDPATSDMCDVPTGGCVNTTIQVCGNGTLETPEQCDDGNAVSGDGCSAACELPNAGTITADINRGGSLPGTDRGVESAAGNLVADAQWWATSSNGAVIAFMNPGGLRSDLTFLESAGEGNGIVTFGEAFTFQPFGNMLVTFPMTGAQIVSARSARSLHRVLTGSTKCPE
jgi:cysteine-rich repeat protein